MRRKNKIMAALLACALTAAGTTSALALENEFHGMYRLAAVDSNYLGSQAASYYTYNGSNMFAQDPKTANIREQHPATANFLDQRLRLMYIARVDEELKLVTNFEINSRWGDNNYGAGISGGGAVGADYVNLRTKSAYLDYTFNLVGVPVNSRLGIQPVADSYKGIILDNDAAAAILSSKIGATTLTVGFSRFADNGNLNSYSATTDYTGNGEPTPNTNGNLFGGGLAVTNTNGANGAAYGDVSADFWILDAKYDINNNVTVGASYYLLYSDIAKKLSSTNATAKYRENVHMLGANAKGKFGPAQIDGFFVYQIGRTTDRDIYAFAGNLGAKVKAGPGTVKSEFLYMSGDSGTSSGRTSSFAVIGGEAGYTCSGLQILSRDSLVMSRNNAFFYDNNAGMGVVLGVIGYELPLTSRLTANVNAGFGAVESVNSKIVAASGEYLGTEANVSLPFKAKESLTITPRFAYVFLGDFYKNLAANGKTPDNPYLASLLVNFKF